MGNNKITYKMNVGLYFFFAALFIVLLITSTFYFIIREKLYSEIVENLKSIVSVGADTIDTEAFKKLTSKLTSDNFSQEDITAIEKSAEFIEVYGQLNKIRDSKNGLILYTYILVPGKDKNHATFVVDADVLNNKKDRIPSSEISEFGKTYDISFQPITQKALTEKINIVDTKYVYDEEYKTNSIMGFAPIYDKRTKEYLGTLGADISDENISVFLNKVLITSLILTFAAIGIIIVISIFLAGSVSKPITKLSEVVNQFSNKEFAVRASFDTHIREISDLIINFNSMAQTIQSYNEYLVSLNSSYERFIPVEFLSYLSKENIIEVKLGDQIQKDMAVMFSDIRSFSTLSESMTPKQTFDFLNSYLFHVGPVIRKNSGFVDKYLGDGVMALFPRGAEDAILAAIEMSQGLAGYNKSRVEQGLVEIRSGIGIHIGTLMLGTIGEEKRMQGTVISDSVNQAYRLENLTKDFGSSLIISKEMFSRLENPDKYKYRFLGNTNVKGKTDNISIFEIYDGDPEETITLKDLTKREFENAVYNYGIEEYLGAEALFRNVLTRYPEDKASHLYLEKCKEKIIENNERQA